jgi:precorrin-2 dehydrogenase/sirohydrochlorin ferrochelatase
MIDHQKDSAIKPPMESPFPPTETGAGLLLAWQIKGKPVLVIGGGAVAAGRISALLNASAIITLISPYEGLSPEVLWRLEVEKTITTYHDRTYAGREDLEGFEMVLTAIDQAGLSSEICVICRELRIAVNVADVPPECRLILSCSSRFSH